MTCVSLPDPVIRRTRHKRHARTSSTASSGNVPAQPDQRDLSDRSDRTHGQPAPFRTRIPTDIVSEIALQALEDNPNVGLVFGAVCRSWRAIVHSTPAIWTHLVLTGLRPRSKTELWRKRSKDHVRTLEVSSSFPSWAMPDWLSTIRDMNAGVRALYLFGEHDLDIFGWDNSFPRLESLALDSRMRRSSVQLCSFSSALQGFGLTPRAFRYNCFAGSFAPTELHTQAIVPFEMMRMSVQANDLVAGGVEVPVKTFEIQDTIFESDRLAGFTDIQQLILKGCYVWASSRFEPCTLPALERMCVHSSSIPDVIVPKLVELQLYSCLNTHEILTRGHLLNILGKLVALDLCRGTFSEGWLMDVLHCLPQLTYLGLAGCPIGDRTISYLASEKKQRCPKLYAINLAYTNVTPWGVRAIINSRLPAQEHIKLEAVRRPLLSRALWNTLEKLRYGLPMRNHVCLPTASGPQDVPREPPSNKCARTPLRWLSIKLWDEDKDLLSVFRRRVHCVYSVPDTDLDCLLGQGQFDWRIEDGPGESGACSIVWQSESFWDL